MNQVSLSGAGQPWGNPAANSVASKSHGRRVGRFPGQNGAFVQKWKFLGADRGIS